MEMNRPSSSSSSSTSSLSKQKTIYLWFQTLNRRGNETEKKSSWYKLSPTQFHSPDSDLILVSETNLNRASSAVAWDSTIYVLAGSSSNPTRQVFYFDSLRPDIGWKLGPALIWPRCNATATVRGGKIHTLGEVELKPTVYEERGEMIDPLLSVSREEKDDKLNPDCDGIDYSYYKSKVYLNRKVGFWNSGEEVMGLGEGMLPPSRGYDRHKHPAFLVDVGQGRLCLMWESDKGLHCTKFRVSVHSDGRYVTAPLATVEAFRIFSSYEGSRWDSLKGGDSRRWRDCLVV